MDGQTFYSLMADWAKCIQPVGVLLTQVASKRCCHQPNGYKQCALTHKPLGLGQNVSERWHSAVCNNSCWCHNTIGIYLLNTLSKLWHGCISALRMHQFAHQIFAFSICIAKLQHSPCGHLNNVNALSVTLVKWSQVIVQVQTQEPWFCYVMLYTGQETMAIIWAII